MYPRRLFEVYCPRRFCNFSFRSERLAPSDKNGSTALKTELVETEPASDGGASSAVAPPSPAAAVWDISDEVEGGVTPGLRNNFGQESLGQGLDEASKSEMREEEGNDGVLAAVRVMLATPYNATFFAAVGMSGMGAGVIDMFLFIR